MSEHRCDKAHHASDPDGPPVAVRVLTCQGCGSVYARCADCQRLAPSSAEAWMRGHLGASYCLSRAARRGGV